MEKVLLNIGEFGNTSGVSIPLLISSNFDKFKNTESVLMSGYGSGLNWGNGVINLSKVEIFPLKEI